MAFHVRDHETDRLVRELARRKGIGLTEAVKRAVRSELERDAGRTTLHEKLRHIADSLAAYPDTGLKVDKEFFDDLSGD